ncbi:MAG: phage virion morphogenesis protein [Anaerovorax sp.]
MSSVRLEGDISKLKAQIDKLEKVDFKSVSNALAEVARTSTMDRFKQQVDPNEKKWPESTRVKEIGGRTLTDTGGLRKSIRSKVSNTGFALGTNLKYAATHQFGDQGRVIQAKNKKSLRFRIGGKWVVKKKVIVNIPARPYLGINGEDIEEMVGTIEDYLLEE